MVDAILLGVCSIAWGINVYVNLRLVPAKYAAEMAYDQDLRVGLRIGEYVPIIITLILAVWAFFKIEWWLVILSLVLGQLIGGVFGSLFVVKGLRSDISAAEVKSRSWGIAWASIFVGGYMVFRFLK